MSSTCHVSVERPIKHSCFEIGVPMMRELEVVGSRLESEIRVEVREDDVDVIPDAADLRATPSTRVAVPKRRCAMQHTITSVAGNGMRRVT